MDIPGKRSSFVAAIAGVAIAGGAALGLAGTCAATGTDLAPWSTTHGHAAMVDADAGKVTPQPFVITKKLDVSSPVLS
jgi:type VI protein secretion system component Hcp